MNIRIEISEALPEDELIIRCRRIDENILQLQNVILETMAAKPVMTFYKHDEEFYFSIENILFFETSDEAVYAHTASDAFLVKQRLYELESVLPPTFLRISKSALLNTRQVYSIQRNLTASSLVQFQNSHKQVYVSRLYYKVLRQKLSERG